MKTKAIMFVAATGLLHAGNPDATVAAAPKPEPWVKPLIDIRARYEFGDVDGFDASHALTFRERLGLQSRDWNGFSVLVEGEFSQAAIDDYNGGAPGARPFDPANSTIADPETNELNQAYLQYAGHDTTVKAGRQRLIYDNAAFVGNVGWRQNEQTFDAVSLSNESIGGLKLNYAYLNQVNRIYGSDADSPLSITPNVRDIGSEVHSFNAAYSGIEGVTFGGYAYVMDFEDLPAWDNNTFGASAKGSMAGVQLYGELAWQDKAGPAGDDEASYAHVTATKTIGNQSVTLGMEHLGQGFKTPLATVHAFNGFADTLAGGRLDGSQNGLADFYLSHTMTLFYGIKWTNALHAFGDDRIDAGYGWEYDSVLLKKFTDNFTSIAKVAHFESGGDPYTGGAAGKAAPTATRFSLELDYTF